MTNQDYFKVKRGPITEVYNDGVITFTVKEVKKDKFGTPINEYEEETIAEDWFRWLGVTAQDIYYANADDHRITAKVGVKGHVNVDVKWRAYLTSNPSQPYEVYRAFYNYSRNETELSLVEVRQ